MVIDRASAIGSEYLLVLLLSIRYPQTVLRAFVFRSPNVGKRSIQETDESADPTSCDQDFGEQ